MCFLCRIFSVCTLSDEIRFVCSVTLSRVTKKALKKSPNGIYDRLTDLEISPGDSLITQSAKHQQKHTQLNKTI